MNALNIFFTFKEFHYLFTSKFTIISVLLPGCYAFLYTHSENLVPNKTITIDFFPLFYRPPLCFKIYTNVVRRNSFPITLWADKAYRNWSLFYLQSTEEQAVWIRLMLGCKVVIVEEPHSEYSVVHTNTHVWNDYTWYNLKQKQTWAQFLLIFEKYFRVNQFNTIQLSCLLEYVELYSEQ